MSELKSRNDRRKAKWEILLNPMVTLMVVAFCVGILLVWIGIFEHNVNPNEGIISGYLSEFICKIREYFS